EEPFQVAVPDLMVRLSAIKSSEAATRRPDRTSQVRVVGALRDAKIRVEAVLEGPTLRMNDLVGVQRGQILMLGHPSGTLFNCRLNGKLKFRGEIVQQNGRR